MSNNPAAILVPVIVILISLAYAPGNDHIPEQDSNQLLTTAEMKNNNIYGRTGAMTAKEGAADQLLDILLEAAKLVSGLDGCRLYIVGKDREDPDTIWVQESWNSKEDHAASLAHPGVRELINKAMPLIKAFPELYYHDESTAISKADTKKKLLDLWDRGTDEIDKTWPVLRRAKKPYPTWPSRST